MLKRLLIFSTLFLLILLLLNYFYRNNKNQIVDYLSVTRIVEAEYLIIEGWISDESMNNAIAEFKQNDYKSIIVTGGPLEPYYLMSTEGFFEFSFPVSKKLEKGDTIQLDLKGTAVKNIFPHFTLFLNGTAVNEGYTSANWELYSYVTDSSFLLNTLTVSFNNDKPYRLNI